MKVVERLADRQMCIREFQTLEVVMLEAFIDNINAIHSTHTAFIYFYTFDTRLCHKGIMF